MKLKPLDLEVKIKQGKIELFFLADVMHFFQKDGTYLSRGLTSLFRRVNGQN